MYDSIIAACKEMDAFALPRAVGQFKSNRFIFANVSFLRATGLMRREISSLALSTVAKFHFDSVSALKRAKLAPITIRSFDRNLSIGGFAAFNREGLVYLMIPAAPETNEAFQMGKAVGLETERLRISAYLHERLAPGLLAIMFSLEAVREQLEQEKHSAEPKLKQVCHDLDELLRPLHEELLSPAPRGSGQRAKRIDQNAQKGPQRSPHGASGSDSYKGGAERRPN
jgi:signal transduction histidine kinase